DQVGANRAEITDFGGRFVAGAGERGVNAFVRFDAQALGFDERGFAIGFPVSLGHVGKARAEAVVVGADERIGALQVDVVGEDDERALLVVGVDAAGSVGEDGGANSQAAEDADREDDFVRRVTFVGVHAALHGRDG